MKQKESKIFLTVAITVLSMLFTIFSAVPLVGPSLGSYGLGMNLCRYKHYGFVFIHGLIAILVGQLIFAIMSSLILRYILELYKPDRIGVFWLLITLCLILNYIFSIVFYVLGIKKAKRNN